MFISQFLNNFTLSYFLQVVSLVFYAHLDLVIMLKIQHDIIEYLSLRKILIFIYFKILKQPIENGPTHNSPHSFQLF